MLLRRRIDWRLLETLFFALMRRTLRVFLATFLDRFVFRADLRLRRDLDFLAFLLLFGLEAFLFLAEALRLRPPAFLAFLPRRFPAERFPFADMETLNNAPLLTSAPVFTALAMATLIAIEEAWTLCAFRYFKMAV